MEEGGALQGPSLQETAPWNTVGLPQPSAVRRAVKEIETRLQQTDEKASKRKDDKLIESQVARTRLLWQARERGHEVKTPVEFRTDFYPDQEPRGENVIILKLEEVPSVEKKDVTVQTNESEAIETLEIKTYLNYERSWRDFRDFVWNSKAPGTVNSRRISDIESNIPRVRKERICAKCRRGVVGDGLFCSFHDEVNPAFNIDPQRSRSNFFGNSSSYALRCNLFAAGQNYALRKKFYMSPEPVKVDLKKQDSGFETFQAKKRVFYKRKLVKPPGESVIDFW